MYKLRYFISVISLFSLSATNLCVADFWVAPGNMYVSKVLSASKNKAGNVLSICLIIHHPETKDKITATLEVFINDQKKWEVYRFKSQEIKGVLRKAKTVISFNSNLADLKIGCLQSDRKLSFNTYDLFKYRKERRNSDAVTFFKLKKKTDSAIFVLMARGDIPTAIHYVSAKPIFENTYTIQISLQARFRYTGSLCQKQTLIEDSFDKKSIHAKDRLYRTQLHCAALENNTVRIKFLLSKGLDKDALTHDDVTPMYMAAANGNFNAVKVLLENKANPHLETAQSSTPLFVAAAKGHLSIVELLIKHNANIDKTSDYGGTPLMAAARFGHAEIVKALLKSGADKEISDNNDKTAYRWAKIMNHKNIIILLE